VLRVLSRHWLPWPNEFYILGSLPINRQAACCLHLCLYEGKESVVGLRIQDYFLRGWFAALPARLLSMGMFLYFNSYNKSGFMSRPVLATAVVPARQDPVAKNKGTN